MNDTPDTERHRTTPGVVHLAPDALYQRLIEALRLLAEGSPLEREQFFGEPVPVNARDRRESVRLLRRWSRPAAASAPVAPTHEVSRSEDVWRG
jgi:hypothetical protein